MARIKKAGDWHPPCLFIFSNRYQSIFDFVIGIDRIVVRVGSRMYDNSLSSKLQRLEIAMKGAA